MPGLRGVGFEFLPQVAHVDAQVVALPVVRWPPDFAQQLAVRQHAAGIADQHREQAVFKRRQMDFQPKAGKSEVFAEGWLESDTAVSPVLGMTWHARDTLNLYANYDKGFETPTPAEVAYTSSGTTAIPLFNPRLNASKSQHYELVAKWLPTPESRLDFNLYRINSVNEIVVSSRSNGQSAYKNAPGTTRTGVELAGQVLLDPHWRAALSASWINARFSQAYASNGVVAASGSKLPGIPGHFVFSELVWSSQTLGGAATLSKSRVNPGTQAGLELTNAGRLFANDVNTASADGYTTLSARLSQGWNIGPDLLTAYGRIDNLTGRRYVGSVIVNQAAGQYYEPATGRSWSLGLRVTLAL